MRESRWNKPQKLILLGAGVALSLVIVFTSLHFLKGEETTTTQEANTQEEILEVNKEEPTVNYPITYNKAIGKAPPEHNPLISHRFGADPFALVFQDRVYLYMTHDIVEYDSNGAVKDNSYSKVNQISVISSADLVNWTDHGVIPVAGPQGAAKWATQSWAPAAAHKVIDGKDQFFLYFSNNASGIGVLTSDSPVGPWVDPLKKPLIARNTPASEGVEWLFDPAVYTDEDGKAYIYYGGGIPAGKEAMPNTARVMELGEDMISLVGDAQVIPAPYLFEASGMNKYNGKYYYSYSSNFAPGDRPEGNPPAGEIAYMIGDTPMGPWTYKGSILKNPGHFFGAGGNNHHTIFQFKDQWYITYHAQTVAQEMGIAKGYRSTHINSLSFNEDGSIEPVAANKQGVKQLQTLDPYSRVEAETLAWSAGIEVIEQSAGMKMMVTDIDNGDWTALSQVDFGTEGAVRFEASVASGGAGGVLELRLDGVDGELIGTLTIPSTGGWEEWTSVETEITGAVGTHDLYFVYRGNPEQKLFNLDHWKFIK